MRKYLSVIMLIARSSIYKITPVLALMVLSEYFLFKRKLDLSVNESVFPYQPLLDTIFSESGTAWIFLIAFLIITFLLCRTGCEFKNKQGLTLRRLRISEKRVFVCQWIYNTCIFLVLWGSQLLTVMGLCFVFANNPACSEFGSHTVFAAFYRNDFLHGLLPLAEYGIYIRNFILASALGIASAVFPFKQRSGKIGYEILILSAASVLFFRISMGSIDFTGIMILICVFVIFITIMYIWGKED